jgi:hypothetical protein
MALTPGMKLGRESLVDIAIRDASLDEEYVPFGLRYVTRRGDFITTFMSR